MGQEKPLRPSQCRTHLRKTVAAAYRDIVAGFVDQAKGGSCQHLKMATEVVDSEKRAKGGSRAKGPATAMLAELELYEAELKAAEGGASEGTPIL